MSFASSCALKRVGRALAGPISVIGGLLVELDPEIGLVDAPLSGRSCLAQSRE
jgi:hypothetical protein